MPTRTLLIKNFCESLTIQPPTNKLIDTKWIQNNINKIVLIIPLIITYLTGPLGILIYWLIRIFYAKNMKLYD